MENFEIIWKFAVVGLLLAITLSLSMIKIRLESIEKLLNVPDMELPENGAWE